MIDASVNPWTVHAVHVKRVLEETPGVATYDLAFDDPAIGQRFRFLPGQFNMLYVPGIGEAAISISSDADTKLPLRHTIRAVGGVTRAIAQGGAGMSLGLRGPFGSHWPVEQWLGDLDQRWEILIVAGGIGLAPLRPAIYSLLRHRGRVESITILIGARTPADLLYGAEYDDWRTAGAHVDATVDRGSDGWRGHIGTVTVLLDRAPIARPVATAVLACGPEVMMNYVVQTSLRRKIPAANIWLSLERHMNCGVGLCGHCQWGPEFLCKDGPVMAYARVAPWIKVQAF